ncbi:unnamed protein product [Phytophthora lilii]|uniref:Unnamed protein product n=1 Tax=Phytophthora lilii TaxID=2077276 RepID=A0A9W6X3G1_9STRA|nr:unnamed protein product [Phytophthora lilii]
MLFRDVADYDPQRLLGHQTAPDDEDDEDCAVCVALGINSTIATPELSIREEIVAAYADDHFDSAIINHLPSVLPATRRWQRLRVRLEVILNGTNLTAIC